MQRDLSQRRNWKQSPCSKDSPVPGKPPALGHSADLCLFVYFMKFLATSNNRR